MPISEIIKQHVRQAIESGISLSDIAKACEVNQPTLWRFMDGADAKASTLDKLASHFGLDLFPINGRKAPTDQKPTKKPGKK